MSNNDKRPKSTFFLNLDLLNILSIYLERNNIICDSKELSPLEYVWRNISHKPYTKHEFIDELIRNDYCVKTTSDADDDLNSELMRLGFKRNAWFHIFLRVILRYIIKQVDFYKVLIQYVAPKDTQLLLLKYQSQACTLNC
jgi:hypothetical protein